MVISLNFVANFHIDLFNKFLLEFLGNKLIFLEKGYSWTLFLGMSLSGVRAG